MIKRKIPFIVFILNMFFLKSVFGQAQVSIPDYINQKFQSYCNSVIREEIFIHTDREEYISGEDFWFNIYLIDRQSLKPSLNSKIAYVEILNPENRPVLQKRIMIDKGFGPGQAVLPDTLSSGTYTIRAYTNWMKNFLPYNCFLKEIKVYNALSTKVFRRSVRSFVNKETATDTLTVRSGLILKVNYLKQDSLEIFVHTDEKFRSENKNQIYLFIQTHGVINHLSTEKLPGENTRIAIPKKSLLPGINQITIFDSKGPVCDRFIYTPYRAKPEMTILSIDSCKKRNEVAIEIEIGSDSSQIPDLSNLSVSVSPVSISQQIMDLNDYLVPGTEFGLFPMNRINGRRFTELPPDIMDSLMLTLKSNWIIWETIFSNEVQIYKYPIENEDHYVSGILLTSKLQPAPSDEILLMSTPGREAGFQYTRTDKDGNFNFRIHIDEELKDLIIQPDIESKNQKVYIEPSFSYQYLPAEIYIDSLSKPVPSLISRPGINYLVRKNYGSSSVGERMTPFIPPLNPRRFYGTPDFELNMTDFIKLGSLQEIFFELVPHVSMEYINSVYEMSVVDAFRKKLDGTPCVMIDGVIIKDLSAIANLDPAHVEKIDVVWEEYRVGEYLFNGIVNIISKTGDFSGGILPADAVRLQYEVIDTVCSFVSPDYSSNEMRSSRIADFRNTLYWNPSVKPDKNGIARIKFWTADIKSDYIINVQGITSKGNTVSLRKKIKIR
jgi:hypothetical protein